MARATAAASWLCALISRNPGDSGVPTAWSICEFVGDSAGGGRLPSRLPPSGGTFFFSFPLLSSPIVRICADILRTFCGHDVDILRTARLRAASRSRRLAAPENHRGNSGINRSGSATTSQSTSTRTSRNLAGTLAPSAASSTVMPSRRPESVCCCTHDQNRTRSPTTSSVDLRSCCAMRSVFGWSDKSVRIGIQSPAIRDGLPVRQLPVILQGPGRDSNPVWLALSAKRSQPPSFRSSPASPGYFAGAQGRVFPPCRRGFVIVCLQIALSAVLRAPVGPRDCGLSSRRPRPGRRQTDACSASRSIRARRAHIPADSYRTRDSAVSAADQSVGSFSRFCSQNCAMRSSICWAFAWPIPWMSVRRRSEAV